MKCQKCGKNLPDDAFYCYVCGSKVKPDIYEEEPSVTNKQEVQTPRTSIENEDISNENSSTEIENNTCDNTTSAKESNPNEDSSKHTEQSPETTPELKTQKSSTIYWIAGIIFVIGLIIKGCNAVLVRDNQKRLLNYAEKNYGSIQNMVFQDSGSNSTSPSNAVNFEQQSPNTKSEKGKTFQRKRLEALYDKLSKDFYVADSYETFEKSMTDENQRKKFYDAVKAKRLQYIKSVSSFDEFEQALGYKERILLPIPNGGDPNDPNSYNYKQAHKNETQISKQHTNSPSSKSLDSIRPEKKFFDCKSGHFSLEYPTNYQQCKIQNAPHMLIELESDKVLLSISMWNALDVPEDFDLWQDDIFELYKEKCKYRNAPNYTTTDYKRTALKIKGRTIHVIEKNMIYKASLPDGRSISVPATEYLYYYKKKQILLHAHSYEGEEKGLDVWEGLQLH